jgi:hypothetical protein
VRGKTDRQDAKDAKRRQEPESVTADARRWTPMGLSPQRHRGHRGKMRDGSGERRGSCRVPACRNEFRPPDARHLPRGAFRSLGNPLKKWREPRCVRTAQPQGARRTLCPLGHCDDEQRSGWAVRTQPGGTLGLAPPCFVTPHRRVLQTRLPRRSSPEATTPSVAAPPLLQRAANAAGAAPPSSPERRRAAEGRPGRASVREAVVSWSRCSMLRERPNTTAGAPLPPISVHLCSSVADSPLCAPSVSLCLCASAVNAHE